MCHPLRRPCVVNVFVSYAHSGREWTDERRERWRRLVVAFAQLLDRYVRVEADFFRSVDPSVDWTRYGPRSIQAADVVVIVGNDEYWKRWDGTNPPDEGAGVAREADALLGLYNRDQRAFQEKVVVVLLPGEDSRTVPDDLARVHTYRVGTLDLDGIEPLLRRLFGIPEFPRRPRLTGLGACETRSGPP